MNRLKFKINMRKCLNIFIVLLLILSLTVNAFSIKTLLTYDNNGVTKTGNTYYQNITGLSVVGEQSITSIVDTVMPSIVYIEITTSNSKNNIFNPSSSSSSGSGIVLTEDGYIATNYHVVSYADKKSYPNYTTTIQVTLSNDITVEAEYIAGDASSDLAIIKVDLKGLTPAKLGDSEAIRVGSFAMAIGNPLGQDFAGTVTVGIISGLNRNVQIDGYTYNLIQTDASINAGNSGGALINADGEVIGISNAKISSTGVEGIGFAIPINDAKEVLNDLMEYGYVKGRIEFGISGTTITEVMSNRYNLPVGVYIESIKSDSDASKSGIQEGDIITEISGTKVTSTNDLEDIKANYEVGDTITIKVYRSNAYKTLNLTFTEAK